MASLPKTPQLPRPPFASNLKSALEVYGHITPPNEKDDSDCTRFVGRRLVEIHKEQQQYIQRLEELERYNGDTPSSKNDRIDAVWEEIGDLKSKVDGIDDKVGDLASKVEDNIQEVDEKIDGIEVCLLERIDEVEVNADGRCADLKSDIYALDDKFHRFEKNADRRYLELRADLKDGIKPHERRSDSLDEKLHKFEKNTDRRFDSVDKRFNVVDQRFNDVDERFDQFQLSIKGSLRICRHSIGMESQIASIQQYHLLELIPRFERIYPLQIP